MPDAPSVTIIVIAQGAEPARVAGAVESVRGQVAGAQILVAGNLSDPDLTNTLVPFDGDFTPLDLPQASPAELRNEAVAAAEAPFVVVVEGYERLAPEALPRHLGALSEGLVASYGRIAVHDGGAVRVRPEHGKGGSVFARLLKEKHLVSASCALVWRRDAFGDEAPYGDYSSPAALRLDLSLKLAGKGEFVFHPVVVGERQTEKLDLVGLEEMVRVLVGILYGPDHLEEKLEQRARFRLARHLVAIGKHHYRQEDYRRAGKFFDEAVKAAPGYFKGRRYQFLNFVKNTLTRE